ncbi:MAG: 1-acyl-sn-glycerol-3-phosphate acyltransferase [Archangiaceae bacterium]|nr:1-acyl-sn-glycerol-3-phosphate acyltransferase [Archangiaceae bacterium]
MIASLLLWVWVGLWGTLVASATLILFIPFNPWVDPQRKVVLYLSGLWGWGVLLYVRRFLPVDAYGLEKLESGGPYVLCPNHFSVADTITFLGVLPNFAFVVRKDVFFMPMIGLQLWLSGYVRARESDGGQSVLEGCTRWLERGVSVLMFPEGTRSPDGKVHRFRQGPFLIAQRAGVKVVPIAITGTREIIPKGRSSYQLQRRGQRVMVKVLDPFEVGPDLKAAAQRARAAVQQAVAESYRVDPACAAGSEPTEMG